jgi:hypothetical protein
VALYFIVGYFGNYLPAIIYKVTVIPFIYWLPHVFTGIALAKNEFKIKIPIYWIGLCLLIIAEFYVLRLNHIEHTPYVTPMVLLASIVISAVTIQYNTIQYNTNPGFKQMIQFVGRNTMIIFVSNVLFIFLKRRFLPNLIVTDCSVFTQIFMPFISTIIVIICVFFLCKLLKITKLDKIVI